MIRVIMSDCLQIGIDSFKQRYWTKDFDIPEFEEFVTGSGRDKSADHFVGIEIITDLQELEKTQ